MVKRYYTHQSGMKLCIWDDFVGNYSKLQKLNLQNSTLSTQRIVTRMIFVPVTSLISQSKLVDFEANITSAMGDIAKLTAAHWPRSGITLPPSDLTVGFTTRFENYFRKSINLDDPVNLYTTFSSFLTARSYACLGTVHDADDNAVINAYNKQVQDDPTN